MTLPPRLATACLCFVLVTNETTAQDAVATIHFQSGPPRTGSVSGVTATEIQIRPEDGSTGALGFPYRTIRYIEFPLPSGWNEALNLFASGDYAGAATRLERFASNRSAAMFYPAPGNFATLADRRLVDCYQRLLRLPDLGIVAERINWNLLPEEERGPRELLPVWSAAAKGNWKVVLDLAGTLAPDLPPGDARTGELAYLEGLAHEALKSPGAALLAWGTTTGYFPGAHRHLAQDALKRSALLLADDPQRESELRAALLIYRQAYGNGRLWDGAPADFGKFLDNG